MFQLKSPTVWVEKSKIGFQNGGYSGYFGFPIGTILAIFQLQSTCCYIISFNLICLGICEKMSKTDFQYGGCGGHLGCPIFMILQCSSFQSKSCPVNTEQVSAQNNQRFGMRCRKLVFKMVAVAAILDV